MISKIKNFIKKFKAYNEEKERMQTSFLTRSIYIGYYQQPIFHDGLKMNVKQEDAFLIDNIHNPKTAVRLTGDNTNFTPIPIESWKTSFANEDNYLYIDESGKSYSIQLSSINHPFLYSRHYITLEDLISEMNTRNKTNFQIAKELSKQQSMGLSAGK